MMTSTGEAQRDRSTPTSPSLTGTAYFHSRYPLTTLALSGGLCVGGDETGRVVPNFPCRMSAPHTESGYVLQCRQPGSLNSATARPECGKSCNRSTAPRSRRTDGSDFACLPALVRGSRSTGRAMPRGCASTVWRASRSSATCESSGRLALPLIRGLGQPTSTAILGRHTP